MKRILFVVFDTNNEKINEETKNTITKNLGKEDTYVFLNMDNTNYNEMYCDLKTEINKIVTTVNNFDYVCLLPNGSILNLDTRNIFNEYYEDNQERKEVYLPLVLYSNENINVILNKQVWNEQYAFEPGVLDLELAKKQIDSTIFGAFIPTELFFNKDFYNKDLKHYQQYFMLNNFADKHFVIGIQKLLFTISNWDLKLDNISDEEKTKYFLMARENWKAIK